MPLAMNTFQSLWHLYFYVFELLIILNNNSERTALTSIRYRNIPMWLCWLFFVKCNVCKRLSYPAWSIFQYSFANKHTEHKGICLPLLHMHAQWNKLSGIVPSCTLLWLCCHKRSDHPTFNSTENITSQLNHTYAKRGIHNAFTSH